MVVKHQTAPAMSAIGKSGVWFNNSHSLFPTFTMPNSSALATGHYLGDTGVFGNTIHTGFVVANAAGSVTPFLENDQILGEIDEQIAGNFLNEETLLAAARKMGCSTAAVGKLEPVAIQAEAGYSRQRRCYRSRAVGSNAGWQSTKVCFQDQEIRACPVWTKHSSEVSGGGPDQIF